MAKKPKAKARKKTNPAVYKLIEIVGTSPVSWAEAARAGVMAAARSIRDLRVAEVEQLDVKIEHGTLIYRAKLKLSFKYHGED